MAKREYVLQHSSELRSLVVGPLLRPRGLGVLRLGGAMAEMPEREALERELNRNVYACGCDTSAKGLLLGLAASAVYLGIVLARGPDLSALAITGIVLGCAAAGAAIGKTVGLLRARRRLDRTIREIEARVGPKEPRSHESIACG